MASRECHPLHRGWYSIRRPRSDKHRHRLRVSALLEEYDGRAMASHGSAVAWLDGRVKYDPDQVRNAADANFEEKRREDELRRLGHRVVRLTRSDLASPTLVRQRIEAAIRDDLLTSWTPSLRRGRERVRGP